MNKTLTIATIFIFGLSLITPGYMQQRICYYVTQNGNGARNGKSIPNAWSVSDFNSSANWSINDDSDRIDPGDTVYFSGSIKTGLIPQESGMPGKYIILDGFEADNTTYMNLSESSGRAKIDLNPSGIGINVAGEN